MVHLKRRRLREGTGENLPTPLESLSRVHRESERRPRADVQRHASGGGATVVGASVVAAAGVAVRAEGIREVVEVPPRVFHRRGKIPPGHVREVSRQLGARHVRRHPFDVVQRRRHVDARFVPVPLVDAAAPASDPLAQFRVGANGGVAKTVADLRHRRRGELRVVQSRVQRQRREVRAVQRAQPARRPRPRRRRRRRRGRRALRPRLRPRSPPPPASRPPSASCRERPVCPAPPRRRRRRTRPRLLLPTRRTPQNTRRSPRTIAPRNPRRTASGNARARRIPPRRPARTETDRRCRPGARTDRRRRRRARLASLLRVAIAAPPRG